MTEILRVEHKKHDCGPYRTPDPYDLPINKQDTPKFKKLNRLYGFSDRIATEHCDNTYHPMPYEDGIDIDHYAFDGRYDSWIYGFMDIEQAAEWFAGWENRLKKWGFVLKTYEVPDENIKVGAKQVAFNREAAVFVRKQPILTLLDAL